MFKTTTYNQNYINKPAQAQEYKLFIGCIPGSASDESILSLLSQYAEIQSLKLERRKNNKCSGYGYASVSSEDNY